MTTSTQRGDPMTRDRMRELVERHIAAESAGDVDGALHGLEGARGFYEHLTTNVRTGAQLTA